jgi:hypothetical protein
MFMNSTPGTVAASEHSRSAEKTAIEQENGIGTVKVIYVNQRHCFAPSPRRPYVEYKRMVLEHTHGLFIT